MGFLKDLGGKVFVGLLKSVLEDMAGELGADYLEKIADDHSPEIQEAYVEAVASGLSGEEAAVVGAARMLKHMAGVGEH